MRIIALDVHRRFAQVAVLEDGKIRNAGRIDLEHSRLLQFAKTLKPDDEIIIEATGNCPPSAPLRQWAVFAYGGFLDHRSRKERR